MKTTSRIVRWGTLAAVVAVMSGCCIAPWGGPRHGYGYGYDDRGSYERGGYDHGGYDRGNYDHSGGWHR